MSRRSVILCCLGALWHRTATATAKTDRSRYNHVFVVNLVQLASFVLVAEELNFRKAAEKLHLSQPALSRQIRVLEESLGVDLFTRTRRGVHLTGSGALLLDESRDLLAAARRLEKLVGPEGGESGSIVIGVSAGVAERIRSVGMHFQKCHPRIQLAYRENSSTAQNLALRRKEIDVGFLRAPVNPAYVVSVPLFIEPLIVVLPKSHALARAKRIKLLQLADEPLFLRPRKSGSGLHDKVLAMYSSAGIKPRVIHTTLSPQFVGDTHVASGQGIYILPEHVVMENDQLATVLLDEPDASREVHIAWRKDERSPHILQFVDTARGLFMYKGRNHLPAVKRPPQAKH